MDELAICPYVLCGPPRRVCVVGPGVWGHWSVLWFLVHFFEVLALPVNSMLLNRDDSISNQVRVF